MSRQSRYCDHFIYACMVLFAFSLTISIAVSQGALILGLLGWGVKIFYERKLNWERTPVDYALLAFLSAGVLSAMLGVDRVNSLVGMRTFWTFLIIYILYNNVHDLGRVKLLASSLFLGAAASAIHVSTVSILDLASGMEPDLVGDMTRSGQLMIVCGLGSAGLIFKKDLKGRLVYAGFFALILAAVFLQFKRGAWIALICVLIVQAVLISPKKILVILIVCICLFAVFQPARERLFGIRDEFSVDSGGRAAMWRTVPAMIRDHPMGVGLDNAGDLMYSYDPSIELKHGKVHHSHLHNSYLQVLVEMGFLGLAAFLAFLWVFVDVSKKLFRKIPGRYPYEKGFALGAFSCFIGFIVNGAVEHNFGDSQVAMLVFFIMGLSFIIDRRITAL